MVSFAFAMMLCLNLCIKSNAHLDIILHLLISSPMNQLILLNLVLNIIILSGVFLKKFFFGSLLSMERKLVPEFLTKFMILKIMIISTIYEPSKGFIQITVWTFIYAVFALFQVLSALCKERYNNITTYAPLASIYHHFKLSTLLFLLLLANMCWFLIVFPYFWEQGLLFLLIFECLTNFLETFQTIGKNVVNLIDIIVCGNQPGTWDTRSFLVYFIEFCTDCLMLLLNLLHHCHIFYLNGFSFSLNDLIVDVHLYLSISNVFGTLLAKIKSAQNYWKLTQDMDKRFKRISKTELETMTDLTCAICRDDITASSGRRLPCDHIFHYSCLRSWLERESFCPICKRSLFPDKPRNSQPNPTRTNTHPPRMDQAAFTHPVQGSPIQAHTFPQEQTIQGHTGGLPHTLPQVPPSMPFMHPFYSSNPYGFYNPTDNGFFFFEIQRISELLPHVPLHIIYEELIRTQSVEVAIDNFLNGRVNLNMAE